jgi:hypothetical protein
MRWNAASVRSICRKARCWPSPSAQASPAKQSRNARAVSSGDALRARRLSRKESSPEPWLRQAQQQVALRAEALQQRRRREADFARHVGERQAHRADAADHAGGSRQDLLVGNAARTGRHLDRRSLADYK